MSAKCAAFTLLFICSERNIVRARSKHSQILTLVGLFPIGAALSLLCCAARDQKKGLTILKLICGFLFNLVSASCERTVLFFFFLEKRTNLSIDCQTCFSSPRGWFTVQNLPLRWGLQQGCSYGKVLANLRCIDDDSQRPGQHALDGWTHLRHACYLNTALIQHPAASVSQHVCQCER